MKASNKSALVLGSLLVSSAAIAQVDTQGNPFEMVELGQGNAAAIEGWCGADKKIIDGMCGHGKCGAHSFVREGKCGEGKCGDEPK